MKQMWRRSGLAVLVLSAALIGTHQAHAQARLSCNNLISVQGKFFEEHVKYQGPNKEVEKRTVEQIIKRLDGAKLYLRAADVDSIRASMAKLYESLAAGDCGPLKKAQALLVTRIQERGEFAKQTLTSKTFKFNPKTELVLDPDRRKFPASVAEQNEFHRKYLQFQLSNQLATGSSQDEAIQQVVRLYDRVLKRAKDVTDEQLYSDYLDSFGRSLDPHTSYFSRDQLEDFEISMGLSLEGIGATLSSIDGFTVVEQLIDGGSAKSSGLVKPGDKILAVGQVASDGKEGELENVVEMDLRDVVKKIRGPKGSKVRLLLMRTVDGNTKERLTITLTREKIKLEDDAAQLSFIEREVNGKKVPVAVINLPSFYAEAKRGGRSSATDVKRLVAEAKAKGAQSLVLDLASNGGGSLDDAVRMAGLFFAQGNVVKQSGRDPDRPAMALDDRDPAVDWTGPLVVLTSRASASASEIVAGTLRDYERAVVVGADHTFGKGSVQSVQHLRQGLGAIKVTVGLFYTPGGFSTQWKGVPAHIELPSALSVDDVGEKTLDYSLQPDRKESFISKEAFVAIGPSAWAKVTNDEIRQLSQRSKGRVAKNAEFKKILDELKKNKARGKLVKLGESLKESKERKDEADQKKNLSKDEKLAEYLKRAEIQEAANVAADLFAIKSRIPLNLVKIPEPPPTTVAKAPRKGTDDQKVEPVGALKRDESPTANSP